MRTKTLKLVKETEPNVCPKEKLISKRCKNGEKKNKDKRDRKKERLEKQKDRKEKKEEKQRNKQLKKADRKEKKEEKQRNKQLKKAEKKKKMEGEKRKLSTSFIFIILQSHRIKNLYLRISYSMSPKSIYIII